MILDDLAKDAYALELARHPGDPLAAAMIVCNGDLSYACELMSICRVDDGFSDRQRRVIEHAGSSDFVPTKDLLSAEVVSLARKPQANDDFKLRAYRLVAEMNGYIEKGGGSQVNVNVTQNRVMVVRRHESLEALESGAMERQAKLIEHASSRE